MTRLRHLAVYVAMHLVRWAFKGNEIVAWALSQPTVAYGWLETGFALEEQYPKVIDAALAHQEQLAREWNNKRLDVN